MGLNMETRKEFDKEHIMRWLNPLVSWDSLCENFEWDEEMLEKYQDRVNWTNIAKNKRIKWDARMIEKFKKRIDWNAFSWQGPKEVYTAEHLEKFKDYWNWYLLSDNRDFELSKELVDAFADYWDWDCLIDWNRLPEGYSFELRRKDKEFIYKARGIDVKCVADLEKAKDWYDVCRWDASFLEKYKEYIDWHKISCNPNIYWTVGMIGQFKDYIDWDAFSGVKDNPYSPHLYTQENLEKYKDYWNWTILSWNGYLEWSMDLLNRFADCWDWGKIVDNWGVEYNCLSEWKEEHDVEVFTEEVLVAFIEEFVQRYQKHIPEEVFETSLMGEMLRRKGDWEFVCTEPYLEKYAHQIRKEVWRDLSSDSYFKAWSYDLLDRYAGIWHWGDIINNEGVAPLFSVDFAVRYQRYIPWYRLDGSLLGEKVREELCGAKGKDLVDLLLANGK